MSDNTVNLKKVHTFLSGSIYTLFEDGNVDFNAILTLHIYLQLTAAQAIGTPDELQQLQETIYFYLTKEEELLDDNASADRRQQLEATFTENCSDFQYVFREGGQMPGLQLLPEWKNYCQIFYEKAGHTADACLELLSAVNIQCEVRSGQHYIAMYMLYRTISSRA